MTVHAVRSRVSLFQKRMANAAKRWLSIYMPYRPAEATPSIFDAEYANGRWGYLRSPKELARFSVIAGYCHYYKPRSAILDIGCGEGILQESLCPSQYARYVGVDFSYEAIKRAMHKQDDKTSFVHADATTYGSAEKFDVIIFNECLYYFEEPLPLVHRYEPFLAKDGIYIVSMFAEIDTARTKQIWKMLEKLYTPETEAKISTKARYCWTIKVFSPSRGNL